MKKLLYILLALLILNACSKNNSLTPRNFSELYKTYPDDFSAVFSAFHLNDSVTRIYFNFNSSYFLHTRKSSRDSFNIEISLNCKLYEDFDTKTSIYHDKFGLNPNSDPNTNKEIQGYFDVPCPYGKQYFLEIGTRDEYRNKVKNSFLEIDKTNKYNHQNFSILNSKGKLILSPNFSIGDSAYITYSPDNPSGVLLGKYLYKTFGPALPPFSYEDDLLLNFVTKEPFEVKESNAKTYPVYFDRKGIYYFKTDSAAKVGISLYCFNEDFPKVTAPAKLIEPLRYITSQKEFDILRDAPDPVIAFEQFWLSIAGSDQDKARSLIKEFYSRVERSNELFSSFTHGWKTDRGMIYIVYGPPTIVYKSKRIETWVFGESGNNQSLNFVFKRITNPLSENDYIINRSNIYRTTYYRAVDRWRAGNIPTR